LKRPALADISNVVDVAEVAIEEQSKSVALSFLKRPALADISNVVDVVEVAETAVP
jgi:hypothetical protein